MTENANANGPVEAPTTAPTASDAPAAAAGGGSETWTSGLRDEDNRAFVEKKQWKSIDDALKSQRELETLLGKSIRLPGDNATADDWNAFYQKMGRPEKPDGYEIKLNPETVPENFPYDAKSATEFRNWAHEAGLNQRQTQALHDKYVGNQAGAYTATIEATAKKESAAHREIVEKWGDPSTPKYQENLTLAGRAIHELGLKDALVEGGIISADGAIKNAAIADAMLKVGKELYREGSATAPGSAKASNKDAAEILYGS